MLDHFPKNRRKNVKNDFSQKCPKSFFQHVGPYSKAPDPFFGQTGQQDHLERRSTGQVFSVVPCRVVVVGSQKSKNLQISARAAHRRPEIQKIGKNRQKSKMSRMIQNDSK